MSADKASSAKIITSALIARSFGGPSSVKDFRTFILNLSGLDAEGIEEDALEAFDHQLRKLNLSGNRIKTLRAVPPRVTWLNLKGNRIKSTKRLKAFRRLGDLVTLILSSNRIAEVRAEDLEGLVKLGALVLDHNRLTSATLRLPRTLRALNTLVLSHNSIESIDRDMLRSMPNLKKLSLSSNLLRALPDISCNARLSELRIAGNRIASLEGAGSGSLAMLDVSGNDISAIDALEGLASFPRLANLALKGNPVDASLADVIPFLKNGALLKVYNGTKRDVELSFAEKTRRKELRRKRNLVSTKFDAPDPTKIRNKPCACGSGIKFKLCCEKKGKKSSNTKRIEHPGGGSNISSRAKRPRQEAIDVAPSGTRREEHANDDSIVEVVINKAKASNNSKRGSVADMLKQRGGRFTAW